MRLIRGGSSWWTVALAAVAAAWPGLGQPPATVHRDGTFHPKLTTRAGAPAAALTGLPALFVEDPREGAAFWIRTADLEAEFRAGVVRFGWRGSVVTLEFQGSSGAEPEGVGLGPARIHVLLGQDRRQWQTDRRSWTGVRYRELYPGIDAIYRAGGRQLKSEFTVAPGADPSLIRMRYHGALGMSAAAGGPLRVATSAGVLEEAAPVAWQERDGERAPVVCGFRVGPDGEVRFDIGPYDPGRTLWIDPAISSSTYLGGARAEAVTAVAVDAAGNAYAAGWTESPNFPSALAGSSFRGSVDAFVAKFDPTGTALVWAAYLGGSGDDRALGVDTDPSGNVYVAGYTASTNFPVIQALQTSLAGGRDVFVTKLSSSGNQLVYSTYYGGGANDMANGLAVDAFGQAYVAGETESANFPTRFPFQAALRGSRDAFTFKIGINGTISYSTFLGGTGDDRAAAIAVSANLTPVLAGCTTSRNFPTRRAQQSLSGGGQDAWVVRFDGDAFVQIYGTYLGGTGGASGSPECAHSVAVDSFNNAYITGVTSSKNFPVLGAFQNTHGGGTLDAFVTKLNSDGIRLYSSYLGGKGVDWGTSIRVDASRRAYVAGYSASANFPSVAAVQTSPGGGYDGFVVRVDSAGSALNFASLLGGSSSDSILALAFRSPGDLFAGGSTGSPNFPVQSPVQEDLSGALDGILVRLTGF